MNLTFKFWKSGVIFGTKQLGSPEKKIIGPDNPTR